MSDINIVGGNTGTITDESEYNSTWATEMQNYTRALEASTNTSWLTQMTIAALQAGVQATLLDKQIEHGQELADQRICFLDNAIKQLCNCYNGIIAKVKDIADEIPEPAMYQPVQPAGEQLETIRSNWEAVPYIDEFMKDVNRKHREADMLRMVAFNPKYYQMNENTWCSIDSLIKGEVEDGTVITILNDRAKTDLLTGRLGNNCRATWRALQVEKENAKARGRAEQRAERASQNQDISSVARQGDLRSMQLTPIEMISVAIQQGQLVQNSSQNAFNACAKKDPYLAQEMQLKLSECLAKMQLEMGKANLVNTFIPNYNSIFGTQVNDAINGLSAGTNNTLTGVFNTPVQSPISTTPVTTPVSTPFYTPDPNSSK